MNGIMPFLHEAKNCLERRLALAWAVRGAAVAAASALGVGLWSRLWPVEREILLLAICVVVGLVTGVVGWARSRPTLNQVARISDRNLDAKERIATALEMSESESRLTPRQLDDTERWVSGIDPRRVVTGRLPRREVGVATSTVLLAALITLLPNPALDRARADQAADDGREDTADAVAELADQLAEEGEPGEGSARREELVRELRLAVEEVRSADDNLDAVAALSRAQDALRDLGAPTAAGRRNAATAAAGALSQSSIGAAAGQALATVGSGAGDELSQMADLLPSLDAGATQALARELAAASSTAGPAVAQQLQKAADQLAAGRTAEAQAALDAAARAQSEEDAQRAADELSKLADQAANLTEAELAELAEALARAAAAAAPDDAKLAERMAKAAKALRERRPSDGAQALREAGDRTEELADEEALDEEVAEAANKLQAKKQDMIMEGCNTAAFGAGAPGAVVTVPTTVPGTPQVCRSPRSKKTKEEEASSSASKQQGGGQRAGQGGSGGQGSTGQSQGSGQERQSEASGQGSSTGGGNDSGGGGSFGASGSLEGLPGAPSEGVYVPGISGPGRTQSAQSDQTGPGIDAALVPYESVYSEYRDAAVSQADRQAFPDRMRQLLLRYFQDEP